MCVGERDNGSYKCCCCFPIFWGVLLIAVVETFDLILAIQLLDIAGLVQSGILLVMFFLGFLKQENPKFRSYLFFVYLASLVIFLVYLITFVATQDVTTYIDSICSWYNGHFDNVGSWDECSSDISDLLWVFVAIYALIVILVRGFFCRVLYGWWKEGEN